MEGNVAVVNEMTEDLLHKLGILEVCESQFLFRCADQYNQKVRYVRDDFMGNCTRENSHAFKEFRNGSKQVGSEELVLARFDD